MSALSRKALTLRFKIMSGSRSERAGAMAQLEATQKVETEILAQYGRLPVAAEVAEKLLISQDEADALIDQLRVNRILEENGAESGEGATAVRRIEQAVRCLPPSERPRYRQEWRAEMASLPLTKWPTYALGLLQSAPRLSAVVGQRAKRTRRA